MNKARKSFKISLAILLSLFQLAVSSPSQTMKRAQKESAINPEIHDVEGHIPVELIPDTLEIGNAPKSMQRIYDWENTNDRIQDPKEFGGKIELSELGPYDPIKGEVFYVPYIPIPVDEMRELHLGKNLSEQLKKVLFFKKDGILYHRFFIHPSRTESYDDYIQKYGIVRTEFAGYLGGSPRSIYAWDLGDSNIKPFQAKTSLHWRVNDDLKINIPNKVHRSFFVNDAFSQISDEAKAKYNFDFLPESLQAMPRGAATMIREIPDEFVRPGGKKYVPGYYLVSHRAKDDDKSTNMRDRERTVEPLLKKWLKGLQGNAKLEAAAEILRPLLRVSAYLMFEEGLKGELHEQNVYFELDAKDQLTGKIYIKDLDSFRTDLELRLRKGRDLEAIRKVFKPFVYLKFLKATNWDQTESATYDQEAFDTMIKHTFGYSACEVMKCTEEQKKKYYRMLDEILAEEVQKITGVDPRVPKSLNSRAPWLSQMAEENRENINAKMNREQLSAAQLNPSVQDVLTAEFQRLRKLKRTSGVKGSVDSNRTYFVLHKDMIEARQIAGRGESDRAIGFAAMEPVGSEGDVKFQTDLKRVMARESILVRPFIAESSSRGQVRMCAKIYKMAR
jgi:hypothetical protein